MQDESNEFSILPTAIAWLFGLYIVPFCVIFFDEVVVQTRWFVRNAPDWLGDAFRIVYWPLIWAVRQFV